jgi:hypothetical protein
MNRMSETTMKLKLLSLRREGDGIEAPNVELTIRLQGSNGRLPFSGTLIVQVPETELPDHNRRGPSEAALQAVGSIAEAFVTLQYAHKAPDLE